MFIITATIFGLTGYVSCDYWGNYHFVTTPGDASQFATREYAECLAEKCFKGYTVEFVKLA